MALTLQTTATGKFPIHLFRAVRSFRSPWGLFECPLCPCSLNFIQPSGVDDRGVRNKRCNVLPVFHPLYRYRPRLRVNDVGAGFAGARSCYFRFTSAFSKGRQEFASGRWHILHPTHPFSCFVSLISTPPMDSAGGKIVMRIWLSAPVNFVLCYPKYCCSSRLKHLTCGRVVGPRSLVPTLAAEDVSRANADAKLLDEN